MDLDPQLGANPIYDESPLWLRGVALKDVVENPRFHMLNKMEAYYRCRQYDHLTYDWDGNVRGLEDSFNVQPGFYVPLRLRRPSARMDLAKAMVRRLTSLLFGRDRWPEITVPDDENAEDYVKELVRISKLQIKMLEARNLGGAQGTSALSFAFVNGRPIVTVHNAKHCTVLRWKEDEEYRPAAALLAYSYKKVVIEGGKPRTRDFYYARYWDEQMEIEWEPIAVEHGNEPGWADREPSKRTFHGYGFCPFYWIQNFPDSQSVDGLSDYDGQLNNLDELNIVLSANSKGTIANLVPTLVVKTDPAMNTGRVDKGVGNAIFSKGGAEYLEIKGDSVRSGMDLAMHIRNAILESASIVIPDPEKIAASKSVSGESLKILYAPMLANCDILREQYGQGIIQICKDMLQAARIVESPRAVPSEDANQVVRVSTIDVGFRLDRTTEEDEETGKKKVVEKRVKRTPGESGDIRLNWGPYFQSTWDDIGKAINAAKTAAGDKPVASHKTAIKMISAMTGVEDVEDEMNAIEEDAEVSLERAQRSFPGSLLDDPKANGGRGDEEDDDDEEDDEE